MNPTQAQTTAAPIIALLAGLLAGTHFLNLSTLDWTTIIASLVAIGAIVWPAIATRSQALKNATGNLLNTTVVTDEASAKALPNNKDVVAVTPEISAAIKKAA